MSSATATRPTPRGRRPVGRRNTRLLAGSVPLIPAAILLAIFMLGPALWAVYGSMTNAALTGRAAKHPRFIGAQNYVNLFTDPDFAKSLLLTLIFLIGSAVLGQNVLGLALALLQRTAHTPIKVVVGTIVVTAWILPEIVAAFALYAYFADNGTVNAMVQGAGLPPVAWLYAHPLLSVILANVWRGTAFSMLVYAAALTEVPPEITESAEVDGANGLQRLLSITLPMIRRSVTTNLMLTTLQTLSVFSLIYVMTSGGPGTDSSTLPVLAYQTAFKFAKVGYGTAIAVVMLVIGAIFSLAYIRMLKPEVD